MDEIAGTVSQCDFGCVSNHAQSRTRHYRIGNGYRYIANNPANWKNDRFSL